MSAPLMPQPRRFAYETGCQPGRCRGQTDQFSPTSGDLDGPATRVLRHPAG